MKILFVSQYYFPESFKITDLCEELQKRGNSITVITGFPNYPQGEIYDDYKSQAKKYIIEYINNVRVIRCPIRPRHKGGVNLFLNYFSYVKKAKKFLKHFDEEFDAIVVFEISPVFQIDVAAYYGNKRKIPVITMCQDIWPEVLTLKGISKKSIPFRIIKKISGNLYRKSSNIIVSSPSFKNYLIEEHNISPDIISFIPQHGTQNLLSYDFSKEENEKTIFLYAGNIGKAQNIDLIIRAFEKIDDKKVQLWIVGNGSEYENCKKYIEMHNLQEKIVLFGWKTREELLEIYRLTDVLIFSLTAKSFVGHTIPSKLQDYLAIGKPIIAAVEGDSRAILDEVNCAICAAPDDVQSLYNAVLEFLAHKKEYFKNSKNGREYFISHFTLKQVTDSFLSYLNSVI